MAIKTEVYESELEAFINDAEGYFIMPRLPYYVVINATSEFNLRNGEYEHELCQCDRLSDADLIADMLNSITK